MEEQENKSDIGKDHDHMRHPEGDAGVDPVGIYGSDPLEKILIIDCKNITSTDDCRAFRCGNSFEKEIRKIE